MATPQSALILGATGRTGRRLLTELLSPSSGFTKIGEYGRHVTPKSNLPSGDLDKLEQKIMDFEKLGESGLKDGNWDVVFITLGTTRASAGSAAQFEKIDKDYVLSAAKAARSSDPSLKQRVVYVSSGGASSSSSFLYLRCKGQTEEGLASLGFSDTVIFRPGYLKGQPQNTVERLFAPVASALSMVSSRFDISLDSLAKSVLNAGKLGSQGIPPECQPQQGGSVDHPYTIITNAGAISLAKV